MTKGRSKEDEKNRCYWRSKSYYSNAECHDHKIM